eukprot:TRINITY_DN11491_c0_g1_i1.p1 TRINITY_DN11491_c0_g1~~TRINITY_DN11491_c0_g1_i1.p1  ORF type:complete len:285 (-),score=56.52 TRINITY_DN11491_c0_g1_i1:26-880(-)
MTKTVSCAALVKYKGQVHISGGVDSEWKTLGCLQSFDPKANSWNLSQKKMKTQRRKHASCLIDSKMYSVGGKDGNGHRLSTLEWLDLKTGELSKASNILGYGRSSLGCNAVGDNTIVITGGIDVEGDPVEEAQIYFCDDDHWQYTTPMKQSRCLHICQALGDQVYISGGRSDSTLRTSYVLDIGTEKWKRLKDLPTAMHSSASSTLDANTIVVTGGHNDHMAFKSVYLFDTRQGTWMRNKTSLRAELWLHTQATLNSTVVGVFGGLDGLGNYKAEDVQFVDLRL